MQRWEMINRFIEKYGYTNYLEIGTQSGANLNEVKCQNKTGVDPDPKAKCHHHMTSDEFFTQNQGTYDCIFIDGLHHHYQVLADILNSLQVLEEGGTIFCHDILPPSEIAQRVPRESQIWTGDCWKAWIDLRRTRDDLEMVCLKDDMGTSFIRRGSQRLLEVDEKKVTYNNFDKNRAKWANVIPAEEYFASRF